MRRVPINQIRDEVSRDKKRELAKRSVESPDNLVFAIDGDDGSIAWTQDGREDLPVFGKLVRSLLRKHRNTANLCSDDAIDAHFLSDGKKLQGNPVVWGSLDSVNVAIMGTDDEPMLVVSSTGRQQCKAAEWLTAFLADCLLYLKACKGDANKAEAKMRLEYATMDATVNIDDPHIETDMKVSRSIVESLTSVHWAIIFAGGGPIGRPLVSSGKHGSYAAVFLVSIDARGAAPTDRGSLERAKLARQHVPSTFSGEAMAHRRLVMSYLQEGIKDAMHTELSARRYAQDFVICPLAVGGGGADIGDEYEEKLYRFALVCAEVRTLVDAETNPAGALRAFDRAAKRCVKPQIAKQVVKEATDIEGDDGQEAEPEIAFEFTTNAYDAEEQMRRYLPTPRHRVESSEPPKSLGKGKGAAEIPATNSAGASADGPDDRMALSRRLKNACSSPFEKMTDSDRALASAISRYLAFAAGDVDQLPEAVKKLISGEE